MVSGYVARLGKGAKGTVPEPDYLLEPNSGRDFAAAGLRALIPTILQRWELAVRLQVPAAHGRDRLQLQDDVPVIAKEVAQALAIGTQRYCENSPATRAHDQERVTLTEYSLGGVIQKYALLREAILDLLFEERFGSREVVRVVNAGLDQSVQEASVRFAAMKEAALRENELLVPKARPLLSLTAPSRRMRRSRSASAIPRRSRPTAAGNGGHD